MRHGRANRVNSGQKGQFFPAVLNKSHTAFHKVAGFYGPNACFAKTHENMISYSFVYKEFFVVLALSITHIYTGFYKFHHFHWGLKNSNFSPNKKWKKLLLRKR